MICLITFACIFPYALESTFHMGEPSQMADVAAAPPSWFSAPQPARQKRAGQGDDGDKEKKHKGDKAADKDKGGKGSKGSGGGGGKLATLNARLTLTLARDVADLKGTVYHRYEMPNANAGLAAAVKAAGVSYNKTSQDMKKQQREGAEVDWKSRGPPHVHVAMAAILYGVGKQFEDGGDAEEIKLRDEMKEFYQKEIFAPGVTALKLGRAIPYFKGQVLKAQNGENPKAIIAMAFHRDTSMGRALSGLMEALVESEDGTYLSGAAPRGPLERQMGEMVTTD